MYRRSGWCPGLDWKISTAPSSRSTPPMPRPRNAAEITKAVLDGDCPAARVALDLFCAMLGTFAGNVALMYGAKGGVYIAGGIAPRLTDFIARSQFRERFEQKGRLRSYVEAIPSSIILHPAATFLGLRSIAKRHSEAAPRWHSASTARQVDPLRQPIASAGNGDSRAYGRVRENAVERWSWRKNASASSPAAVTFPVSTR